MKTIQRFVEKFVDKIAEVLAERIAGVLWEWIIMMFTEDDNAEQSERVDAIDPEVCEE